MEFTILQYGGDDPETLVHERRQVWVRMWK